MKAKKGFFNIIVFLIACAFFCTGFFSCLLSAKASENDEEMSEKTDAGDDYEFPESLKAARALADSIEEEYGVRILISGQCEGVDTFEEYEITTTEIYADKNKSEGEAPDSGGFDEAKAITDALDLLEKVLSDYPDGFFRQIKCRGTKAYGIRFLFIAGLSGDVTAAGLESEGEDSFDIALNVTATNLEVTMNHEIFHAIEGEIQKKDRRIFSDGEWNKLNPEGVVYAGSAANFGILTGYTFTKDTSREIYYYDPYSRTSAKEDRARIFECAMCPEIRPSSEFFENIHVNAKLKYICETIREAFDTTGWEEPLKWESFVIW